jgi:hypothetical protein
MRQQSDPAIQQAANRLLGCKSLRQAYEEYTAWFEDADLHTLQLLTKHENAQVAVWAAWRELLLAIPKHEDRLKDVPDPKTLERFLGFLEGRLHVVAPRWWEQEFLGMKVGSFGAMTVPSPKVELYERTERWLWATNNCSVHESKGNTYLQIGGESTALPPAVDNAIKEHNYHRLSAEADRSRCYLVTHTSICSRSPLYCLDRQSGKVLWRTEIWADWTMALGGGGSNLGFHVITLSVKNDRLLVFGIGPRCCYLEEFRCENGQNVFRFCTIY